MNNLFLEKLQETGENVVYTGYLDTVDGIPVRNVGRGEYVRTDREILASQNYFTDGHIKIREFLMAAAHLFQPLKVDLGKVAVEVFNRPKMNFVQR